MLPNMRDVLVGWEQLLTLKTVTQTTVNFVAVEVVAGASIRAVVQPTIKTDLNKGTLDWTRDNYTFHTASELKHNQLIEYQGRDFKIVEIIAYGDYGYFEAIGEDTKQALKVIDD